jgi:hypothetical protein
MDWKALGNKAAQFLGASLYAAALGVVTGQIPIDPRWAPYVAVLGAGLRTFTDGNALSATSPK